MKKKWLFTLSIVIIAIAMGYIFYSMDVIKTFYWKNESLESYPTMYEAMTSLFDLDLDGLVLPIRTRYSPYLIMYGLILLGFMEILAILVSLLKSSLKFKAFNIINIIVGILIFIPLLIIIYNFIRVDFMFNDVDSAGHMFITIWGHIYCLLGFITALLLIVSARKEEW